MERSGKRAVLVRPNEPLEVWERLIPALAPGEVLLRVELGGVCGTDLHVWRGEIEIPNPIVLGHEGVATIEELGPGVMTDFAGEPVGAGDRVYWNPVDACGRCHACTVAVDTTRCASALTALLQHADAPPCATYAELSLLRRTMPFYKIPDDVPSEAVIAFGCAMPTMLQGLERLGGLTIGQSVVVQGCGPVGLAATLLARASGAGEVIVIGAPAHRLHMARRLGATRTIDLEDVPAAADRLAIVRDATGGRGADVVIEAAGHVAAFAEGLQLASAGGRYLVVGIWSAPGTVAVEPRFVNNQSLRVIGTALFQARHIHGAVQVAKTLHRDLPMASAVTHRFSLAEAEGALRAVAALESVKAVITPRAA